VTVDDPIWIVTDDVLVIHAEQLAEHGGQAGVREMSLLESAIGRPRHLFAYTDPTPTVVELAASYAFGIARNHAFLDGNKRTAYVVCRLFLVQNGVDMMASSDERYSVFLGLAAGTVSEAELAEWLRQHTRPMADE
jgi:death on curing protein